ncbi:MAG: hypothetical protein HYX85_01790 [Chloroflexi bacterium]|nr:hypothetical protein [Chloroflexota bacterium]
MVTLRSKEQIMAENQELKEQIEKKHGKTVEHLRRRQAGECSGNGGISQ